MQRINPFQKFEKRLKENLITLERDRLYKDWIKRLKKSTTSADTINQTDPLVYAIFSDFLGASYSLTFLPELASTAAASVFVPSPSLAGVYCMRLRRSNIRSHNSRLAPKPIIRLRTRLLTPYLQLTINQLYTRRRLIHLLTASTRATYKMLL